MRRYAAFPHETKLSWQALRRHRASLLNGARLRLRECLELRCTDVMEIDSALSRYTPYTLAEGGDEAAAEDVGAVEGALHAARVHRDSAIMAPQHTRITTTLHS